METKKTSLQLSQIDLDLENPRINPANSQLEALKELVRLESIGDKAGEKIHNLAKSICEMGGVDPGDRIYVIEDPQNSDRYIALDGNRRIAALRLLTNPALANNEAVGIPKSMRTRLNALRESARGAIPTQLDVVIFKDRKVAEPYIRLRHNGEQDGAGRSQWEAFQNARSLNSGSFQILQHLRSKSLLDLAAISAIDSGRFPISTFERFAAGKPFHEVFGGTILPTSYHVEDKNSLAMQAWAIIANQTASEEISSRTHQKSESIKPYLIDLRDKLSPHASSEPEGSDQGDSSADERESQNSDSDNSGFKHGNQNSNASNGKHSSTASNDPTSSGFTDNISPKPAKRKSLYLIKKRDRFRSDDNKCNEIITELSKIKVKDAPYACALLIRSLMELTAQQYCIHFGIQLTRNKTECIHKLGVHLTSQRYPSVDPANTTDIGKALMREDKAYEDLSEISHNPYSRIGEDGVRKTWESIREAIELAWRRIHGTPGVAGQLHKKTAECP